MCKGSLSPADGGEPTGGRPGRERGEEEGSNTHGRLDRLREGGKERAVRPTAGWWEKTAMGSSDKVRLVEDLAISYKQTLREMAHELIRC